MGEPPEWYGVIQAAKYLGVPPWDLMNQPVIWMVWALEAQKAEVQAENAARNRSERRSR